jgi:hypothetical protein
VPRGIQMNANITKPYLPKWRINIRSHFYSPS